MFDEEKGYDPADSDSIEKFAMKLQNSTFIDIIKSKGIVFVF